MNLQASGTQNAIINTEHLLATITSPGSFVFEVDTSAMQAADILNLRIYTTTLNGGTSRLAYGPPEGGTFGGDQPVPIKISVPIPSDVECHFTLEQSAGTGRAYPWKVLSL